MRIVVGLGAEKIDDAGTRSGHTINRRTIGAALTHQQFVLNELLAHEQRNRPCVVALDGVPVRRDAFINVFLGKCLAEFRIERDEPRLRTPIGTLALHMKRLGGMSGCNVRPRPAAGIAEHDDLVTLRGHQLRRLHVGGGHPLVRMIVRSILVDGHGFGPKNDPKIYTLFIRSGVRRSWLDALRAALFLLLALGHDGRAEAPTQVFRQFVELGVAVDLDGLLGRIADNVAVVAPGKMVLQFDLGFLVEDAVQVIGQLVQEFRAFHWSPSPLLASLLPLPLSRFWKYRPNRSRNCNRARNNRDFTAGTLNSSAAAVSSVDSPSTSLNTNTVRKPGGRPWMVLPKISRSSD